MFRRWRRMQEEDRGRVWRLYGWYSALMTCGSCVGVDGFDDASHEYQQSKRGFNPC